MSSYLKRNLRKVVVLTVLIALFIALTSANQVTEDQFFTSEEDEINNLQSYLLQNQPTQTEEFSELIENVNNEDAQVAINIYQRTEDGTRDIIAEETALLELDSNVDNDGERQTFNQQFTFPDTNLEPEDSIEIEVLAQFNGAGFEVLTGNEEARFITERLQATGINEHNPTMLYDIEYDSGRGGQADGEIRFFFGDDTNPQNEEVSQLQDFTYEIPPPEIELIEPEDGEVFQSGEEVTYHIQDEYRQIDDENTLYTLDGDERNFDQIDGNEYIIDTTSDWEEGEREIEVIAQNEDGATESQQNTFNVDNTAPEVDIEDPEDGEITNEPEITVTYNLNDENEIVSEEFQLNEMEREPISSGDTIEIEDDGEYDLTIFAEDEAGNEGEDTNTFTLDTQEPDLTITEPENITYNSFEIPLEIEVSGEDTVGYEIFDSNDQFVKEDSLETESTTLEFEERDTYTIEVTAEDEAGNTNTQTETFTVDPEPALFETEITNTNEPVEKGETLTVDAEIENTGDLEDTREIEFYFDDELENTREITLQEDEETVETFEYGTESLEDPGDYITDVISGEEQIEQDENEVRIGFPEIEIGQISIVDVTGEENQRENGELQDEDPEDFDLQDSPEQLEIEQEERNVNYRFEFKVENTGDSTYRVSETETLKHQGINESWKLEDIYIEINDEIIEGGGKTNTDISWDKDGEINPGEQANFQYIIETDTTQSTNYQPDFIIESTDQDTNLVNNHEIDKTKYGFLETQLIEPPEEFTASEGSSFTIEAETTCLEGECGEITKTSRYNETGTEPNTPIPQDEENQPVYTTDTNPETCGIELTNEEICQIQWNVEVTGDTEETVIIDALAESNLDEVETRSKETSIFTIRDSLILDLEFEEINFGTVSPGKDDQEAEQNNLGYNISIPESGLNPQEVRVQSTHLNNSIADEYSIGVGNLSFSLEQDPENSKQMSTQQKLLTDDINPGDTQQTYYWLNIPTGITADTYTGVATFEAIE